MITPLKKDLAAHFKDNMWDKLNSPTAAALHSFQQIIKSRPDEKYVIGFVHIENIASILYSYGEEVSIKSSDDVYEILRRELGEEAVIIRVGFEDMVLYKPLKSKANVNKTMNDFFTAIKRHCSSDIKNLAVFYALSAGLALGTGKDEVTDVFNKAFIALHECRQKNGLHYCLYSDDMENMQQYKNNMQLASYFQSAIYEGRLRLAYQPVISSKNGQIKSYEALLRVVTEDNRLVTAGPFIPVAEKLNLINQVDNMVLKLVVEELKNSPDISLAMNLSSLSIEDGEWLANAKNLLKDNDIASRLIVEITETSMQKDLNKVANFVESMQRLGCKIAIDDFGAGYTSFSQLKVVDADIIKIDGIFVRDIVDNYNSRMFVKTLIEFARGFGLETVAEFVESGDIAKVLMELGVDYMQGHYFSPAVNYRGWLTNQ